MIVFVEQSQEGRIRRAIAAGARTTREIAIALDTTRERISVAVSKMEDDGIVKRDGRVPNVNGPPSIVWRLADR